MNLIISFLLFGLLEASNYEKYISTKQSYSLLLNATERIHATPHITNLIRNGSDNIDIYNPSKLKQLGLKIEDLHIVSAEPNNLDEFYDTEHFRIYFTTQGDSAVEDMNYIYNMAQVYETVYSFFIDTLGYNPPVVDPNINHNLYEIYIERLPSYYFGITYTKNTNVANSACASFIKMRNNYTGSQFSDHSELENIQVTAVHEFFHAIQFSYNCYERIWFMEATAVWSEDELYNDINDLYRYIPSWFSNNNKAIDDESSHMYGSFIYFQYIDEHLGGPGTIKLCWEESQEMASPIHDKSIDAINAALVNHGSSFEDAYLRMRIANRIMNSNAGIYSYDEADGYLSVGSYPLSEDIFFQEGISKTEGYQGLDLYESKYYSIYSSSPINIEMSPSEEKLSMISIVKYINQEAWSVRSGNTINIDTDIDIDWISVIISALDYNGNNWDYILNLNDGYSEDFTLYHPYPNPSFGKPITIDMQIINSQTISTTIYNILGKTVWNTTKQYTEPGFTRLIWDGQNNNGARVANGLYIVKAKGLKKNMIYKIIYLKEE